MVHCKLLKIIIDAFGLAKVMLDMVMWYQVLPNSIVGDRGFVFTSKLWSSLCYLLEIKNNSPLLSIARAMAQQRDRIAL